MDSDFPAEPEEPTPRSSAGANSKTAPITPGAVAQRPSKIPRRIGSTASTPSGSNSAVASPTKAGEKPKFAVEAGKSAAEDEGKEETVAEQKEIDDFEEEERKLLALESQVCLRLLYNV